MYVFFLKVVCPNITGEMLPVAYNADGSGGFYLGCDIGGAFTTRFGSYPCFNSTALSSTSNKPAGGAFNASRSSSIYGGSNIVQPPSLVLNHIIKY